MECSSISLLCVTLHLPCLLLHRVFLNAGLSVFLSPFPFTSSLSHISLYWYCLFSCGPHDQTTGFHQRVLSTINCLLLFFYCCWCFFLLFLLIESSLANQVKVFSQTNTRYVICIQFVLGLSEIPQKTQMCRKNACDGLKNAYYL